MPKDKLATQNCFSAYKRAGAFGVGVIFEQPDFDKYVIDVLGAIEGEISIYMHDADFPMQSPIIFEKIKDGVSFIQTIGTTLGLYSAGATSMRFIDKNRQVAYFHNDLESPFVRQSDLKTLGIPIYIIKHDKNGNEIYKRER